MANAKSVLNTMVTKKNALTKAIESEFVKLNQANMKLSVNDTAYDKVEEEVIELHNEIIKLQELIDKKKEKLYDIELLRSDAMTEIEECETKIKELVDKREQLQCIDVCAFANGTISINGNIIRSFPFWEEVHGYLYGIDTLDCLTDNQMRTMAKLIVLIATISRSVFSFQLFFEEEILEEKYNELTSSEEDT